MGSRESGSGNWTSAVESQVQTVEQQPEKPVGSNWWAWVTWWAHCLGMVQTKEFQHLCIYCAGFIGSCKMKESDKQDSSLLFINTRSHLLSGAYCFNPHWWKQFKVDQLGRCLVFRRTSAWPPVTSGSILLRSGPAPVNKTAFLGKGNDTSISTIFHVLLGLGPQCS